MDTITHAIMGAIVASPMVAERPIESATFVLGSVVPDLDALSRVFGKHAFLESHQTWSHARAVEQLPEFRAMRGLSPAYHVVARESDGSTIQLRCRDLRTRNFATTFGDLEVLLGEDGTVVDRTFHV